MPYRWHHWLKGHTFEETPGDSEGEGSLYALEPQNAKSWTWLRDWTTMTSDLVNGFLKKKKKKIVREKKLDFFLSETRMLITKTLYII